MLRVRGGVRARDDELNETAMERMHLDATSTGVWSMAVIRDVMSKVIVSIRPDATLMDAIKLLTKHHLSGAPVVSRAGEVVGFISEPNLMNVLYNSRLRGAKVSDHMSRDV